MKKQSKWEEMKRRVMEDKPACDISVDPIHLRSEGSSMEAVTKEEHRRRHGRNERSSAAPPMKRQ